MKISHMIVRTSAPSPNAAPRRLDRQHIEQNRELELIVVGVAPWAMCGGQLGSRNATSQALMSPFRNALVRRCAIQ